MRRRVVITGVGCVTPLGADVPPSGMRLTEGESGVGPLTLSTRGTFRYDRGRGSQLGHFGRGRGPAPLGNSPRQTALRWRPASKRSERRDGASDRRSVRFGVYLGCGETFQNFSQFTQIMAEAVEGGRSRPRSSTAGALRGGSPRPRPSRNPTCRRAIWRDVQRPGAELNCLAACASSSQAIGEAVEMIRRGDADAMLSGGTHSMIHPFGVTGFNLLSALSTRNDDPAQACGRSTANATVSCWAKGPPCWSWSLDMPRPAAPKIYGEIDRLRLGRRMPTASPTRIPKAAGRFSACGGPWPTPSSIRTTSATSMPTAPAPRSTTRSRRWRSSGLRHQAYRVPISSTKSMMGHFTAAGGAIELIVCTAGDADRTCCRRRSTMTRPTPSATWTTCPTRPAEVRCRACAEQQFRFRRSERRACRVAVRP